VLFLSRFNESTSQKLQVFELMFVFLYASADPVVLARSVFALQIGDLYPKTNFCKPQEVDQMRF